MPDSLLLREDTFVKPEAGARCQTDPEMEPAGPTNHSYAFLVHSANTLTNNLPPDVDDKPLARQKRRRTRYVVIPCRGVTVLLTGHVVQKTRQCLKPSINAIRSQTRLRVWTSSAV